jgi:hypothetical protein
MLSDAAQATLLDPNPLISQTTPPVLFGFLPIDLLSIHWGFSFGKQRK